MQSRGVDLGLSTPPTQGIHEISATQQYALGKKFVYGDRVYKYGKATATMNMDLLAANNSYGISGYATVPTATAAGETTLYATVGSGEGTAADGAVALDELVGGYVTVFKLNAGASDTTHTFLILANNAVASGGGTVTLTIDQPLPYAASTSAATEINPCPYRYLTTANTGGNRWFVGVPQAVATTTYPYFWVQTWGPCWVAPQSTVGTGANISCVVARHDGSLDLPSTTGYTAAQVVGETMAQVAGGAGTQGTPPIFLRISN